MPWRYTGSLNYQIAEKNTDKKRCGLKVKYIIGYLKLFTEESSFFL